MEKLAPSLENAILLVELLQSKIALLQRRCPVTPSDAWAHAGAYSVRLRKRYTIARVAKAWQLSRATLYRHRPRLRPSVHLPQRHATDTEIVAFLRTWILETPFPAERHRKLWARLRHHGFDVTRERVRRLIKLHELMPAARQVGVATDVPDAMWGIDAASVRTDDGTEAHVLFAVDHCTFECLAIDAVSEESLAAWHAVLDQAVRYAGLNERPRQTTVLRHDNLKLFRSREFRKPLAARGFRCSPIPPLFPQGNAYAERFIRTLRENLLAIRSFGDLASLRTEVRAFRRAYNADWLLSRWDYRPPCEVRSLLCGETLSET